MITFSTFVFSQKIENKADEKEIVICPVKLAFQPADFRYSYRYIIKTDEKGALVKITQLGKDNEPRFVKYEDFIPCMEKWKLIPSEDYFVSFNVGTIFTDRYKNYILISNKMETIKIILPDIGSELVVEN